ncbi:UNVERIFIED_CONTAM: carbamoyltransferase-like protein [Acetivibrio alkalicellulosi]
MNTKIVGKLIRKVYGLGLNYKLKGKKIYSYGSKQGESVLNNIYIKGNENPLVVVIEGFTDKSQIAVGTIKDGKACIVNEKISLKTIEKDSTIRSNNIEVLGLSSDFYKLKSSLIENTFSELPMSLSLLKKNAIPNIPTESTKKLISNLNKSIKNKFNVDDYNKPVFLIEKHLNYAANFYLSPFDKALIWVADTLGDSQSISVWMGEDSKIEELYQTQMFESLGLLYRCVLKHCGILNIKDSMLEKLISYGLEDKYYHVFEKIVNFDDYEGLKFNWTLANWNKRGEMKGFTNKFNKMVGNPISLNKPVVFNSFDDINQHRADILAALQKRIVQVSVDMITYYMEMKEVENLVMAGELFLIKPVAEKLSQMNSNKINIYMSNDNRTDIGGVLNVLINNFNATRPDNKESELFNNKDEKINSIF